MKNMMEHNGYYARIEYSEEDQCFFGEIAGITDVISFEGENIDELKMAFAEAVEDYLNLCRQQGKEPQKLYKGSFNVRINPELHKRAAILAASDGISLNQLVEKAVSKYVH